MFRRIRDIAESFRRWTLRGGAWRTWIGHSAAWTLFNIGGLGLALVAQVVFGVRPFFAFLAVPFGFAVGAFVYGDREADPTDGDFQEALERGDVSGMADSLADLLIPLFVASAEVAGLAYLWVQFFMR